MAHMNSAYASEVKRGSLDDVPRAPRMPVDASFEQLEKGASSLADIISELERRLSPLVRPQPCGGELRADKADQHSAIVERIDGLSACVSCSVNRISALLDALEI